MDHGLVSLAFAAGLVAALNPCGFAMLPAYLVLVIRGEGTEARLVAVGRAMVATAGMSLGFVTVFGLFGVLTLSAGATVQRNLPYLVVVIGVVLVALGIWLLCGRELTLSSSRLLGWRRAPTARLGSIYGYGVSYAIASLSCTVGPFLAVTAAGLRRGSLIGGASVYLAYVAGLTLVVGTLAVGTAVASSAVANRLRRLVPWANRIGGVLLVIVGLYVGYYAVYEIRLVTGRSSPSDVILEAAGRIQGSLGGWVHRHGAWPWLLALTLLVASSLLGAAYRRLRQRQPPADRPT